MFIALLRKKLLPFTWTSWFYLWPIADAFYSSPEIENDFHINVQW
jgi:hypothetical protein